MQKSLIILANSPGEMSGWVAPVVTQVRALLPDVQITVALIPDWFTSGREREFAAQLPVDRVAQREVVAGFDAWTSGRHDLGVNLDLERALDSRKHGRDVAHGWVARLRQHPVQALGGLVNFLGQRLEADRGIHKVTQDQLG